jgi:hypothetical protein
MFTQISPFMTAYFEFRHIPGRVIMCRTRHDAELRFVAGFLCGDVYWELDFEEFHRLAPFDFGFDLDVGWVGGIGGRETYGGLDPAVFADAGA